MKMLVCTDGSVHSQKAMEKALVIADETYIEEVALINVYDIKMDLPSSTWGSRDYSITEEEIRRIKKMHEEEKEKRNTMLQEALTPFVEKNIKARTILVEGHPSHTIVEVAANEGFDLIVIGSRGLGGLK